MGVESGGAAGRCKAEPEPALARHLPLLGRWGKQSHLTGPFALFAAPVEARGAARCGTPKHPSGCGEGGGRCAHTGRRLAVTQRGARACAPHGRQVPKLSVRVEKAHGSCVLAPT